MADSTETAAKYAMPAEEFRRLLTGQIKAEVTDTVWNRLRSTFTLGGFISVSVIIGAIGLAAKWVDSTIDSQVEAQVRPVKERQEAQLQANRAALDQAMATARTTLEQYVSTRADAAAREAVRADIFGVEEVRKRVAERLPQQIATALGTNELREVIRSETSRLMQDARFWRETTRVVMQARARDTTLPPGGRFLAFTDLLYDAESAALARAILAESAARVPERGLMQEQDEARFLRQALSGYAGYLGRNPSSNSFADHQALLARLGVLVDADTSGFELLVQQFEEPRAIAWLVAMARQSSGPQRAAAMAALAGHPAQEARDRVDGLICSDAAMRADLLASIAARPMRLEDDAGAARFATFVRCGKDEILARRLPPIAETCLPDGSLLTVWQLQALPPRRNPAQRRYAEELRARLTGLAETCRWNARLPDGVAIRWTLLSGAASGEQGRRAASGFDGLLPMPADGSEPAWLTALAAGSGDTGQWLADPVANLAQVALLQDRLASLSATVPAVAAAQRRLVLALVAAPVAPGRATERLLLDMLAGSSGRRLCEAAFDAFVATPAALGALPAAAAETIACLRRESTDGKGWAPHLLSLTAAAIAAQPNDGLRQRALLAALGNAAALGEGTPIGPDTAGASLARWLVMLPPEVVPDEEQLRFFPILAQADMPAVLDILERDDETAPRVLNAVRNLPPAASAPLVALLPYLDPDFVTAVPAAPAQPRAVAGRVWSRLVIETPQRVQADRAGGAILLRAGQALEVVGLRTLGDGAESGTLQPGTYLVGAMPDGAPRIGPLPTEIQPGSRTENAPVLREGVTYAVRLRQSATFDVPMTARAQVVIETFALDAPLDTVLTLFNAAGRRVAEDDDGGSERFASRICFTPSEDGTYRLQIRNFDGTLDPPAGFEFRISRVQGCAARR